MWTDGIDGLVESRIELAQYGKTWYPRRIVTSRNGSLLSRTEVKSAEFDLARLPNTLPASVLKLEPGFNVIWQQPPEPGDPAYGRGHAIWNGEEQVSVQQWDEEVRSGKSQPSKRIQDARTRGWMDSPYFTDEQRERAKSRARQMLQSLSEQVPLSGWEQYVRNFILKYDLDAEQSARANQILSQCQAQRHLGAHRDAVRKLNDELIEACQRADSVRIAELRNRLERELRPVEDIFDRELKPRLEKLPTPEQRRLAEGPATQPAASRPSPN